VNLYGTPQHRRVESETAPLVTTGAMPIKEVPDPDLYVGQKVVEQAGSAPQSTSVTRRVYDPKGKLLYDNTWYSSYQGDKQIVNVGTKPKPKPKPKPKAKVGDQSTNLPVTLAPTGPTDTTGTNDTTAATDTVPTGPTG